jgi:hypothetical protein
MPIKDKGYVLSRYFEQILKQDQPLFVKEMLRFFAVILVDCPLAIEPVFKQYADCVNTILNYANTDSPYSLDAAKVIFAFLLAGGRKFKTVRVFFLLTLYYRGLFQASIQQGQFNQAMHAFGNGCCG